MSVELIEWVCEKCYSIMTAKKVRKNRWEIS